MSVRVFAPAKINITLQVGRPRVDGYHLLQSAVMFADVGDWVEAEPASDLSLRISGPFSEGLNGDNLVLRAAHVLQRHAGVSKGAALHLEKNLPVSSGIGGGSSDAAAALKALNELWQLSLDTEALARLGAEIGADVPACVYARASWMSGIGEQVAPLAAPPLEAVLINPRLGLSTGSVFRAFDEAGLGASFAPRAAPVWTLPADVLRDAPVMGNDLMAPARTLLPVIAEMEALLRRDPRVRFANLSGSGATMFALAASSADALALAGDIALTHPDWWSHAVRLT
jgi:4-diphosphocytidyl-2-C-methyl-D-erythritol kinase